MSESTSSPLAFFKLPEASVSGTDNPFLTSDKPALGGRTFSAELSKATDHFKPSSQRHSAERADRRTQDSASDAKHSTRERDTRRSESAGSASKVDSNKPSQHKRSEAAVQAENAPSESEDAKVIGNVMEIRHSTEHRSTDSSIVHDEGDATSGYGKATSATNRHDLNTLADQMLDADPQEIDSDGLSLTEDHTAKSGKTLIRSDQDNVRTQRIRSFDTASAARLDGTSLLSGSSNVSVAGQLSQVNGDVDTLKNPASNLVRQISTETGALTGNKGQSAQISDSFTANAGGQMGSVLSQARLAPQYAQFDASKVAVDKPELLSDVDMLAQEQGIIQKVSRPDLSAMGNRALALESAKRSVTGNAENSSTLVNQELVQAKSSTESVLAGVARQQSLNEQAAQKAHVELVTIQDANLLEKAQAKLQSQINQAAVSVGRSEVDSNNSLTAGQFANNTYLSVTGGIVTAPIAPRLEAGTQVQATNAPLNIPLMADDADKNMASNIRWMVNEGVRNAVVNVTPSGMGPITVQIEMENEQMNVSILAAQGSTREALDAMLPRLRDHLVGQGHENVRLDVSDGKSEQSRNSSSQESGQQLENAFDDSSESGSQSKDAADREIESLPGDLPQDYLAEDDPNSVIPGKTVKSTYDVYV